MYAAEIAVTVLGLLFLAGITWFFWGPRSGGVRAPLTAAGNQELTILVKGGYTPDVVEVDADLPVRLTFRREESAVCTEKVLFPDFDRAVALPQGELVTVEFTPRMRGEFPFTCEMGMVRGRLVVR